MDKGLLKHTKSNRRYLYALSAHLNISQKQNNESAGL